MFSVYGHPHHRHTMSLPDPWISPSGSVRLEAVRYRDAALAGAEVLVIGYAHGSTQLFRLPEARSQLLRDARCPASVPTGRSLRDWLDALCSPVSPEKIGEDPIESTKTII